MPSPSPVRVVSSRTVKPPPRPRELIPLAGWDVAMLSLHYIQKGLLFASPPPLLSTAHVVDHLAGALADALADYYPVAGRLVTDHHRGAPVVGCSVFIDCDGQGVEVVHAVADGVAVADVVPPDVDIPRLVHSFFPHDGRVNYDGHVLPLFVVQVTELADGLFVGFAYCHVLSDGTALWAFLNAWAEIARARLAESGSSPRRPLTSPSRRRPLLERWSPDGHPVVLPCADLSELVDRTPTGPLRERMLHFSAESLMALKERARQELLAAGDMAGATALTRFQALAALLWRCITRARRLAPEQKTTCRAAINNRARLQPPLPPEYFGNSLGAIATEAVRASELLARGGHGWAAAAIGRAVAAHTDATIRASVASWMEKPVVYTAAWFDPCETMMGSSPRFDMYGCDFGWGKALAVRSGKANKYDGKTSLYPGREGGGSMCAELTLTPENMAALLHDEELWVAVSPDAAPAPAEENKA